MSAVRLDGVRAEGEDAASRADDADGDAARADGNAARADDVVDAGQTRCSKRLAVRQRIISAYAPRCRR